MLYMHLLLLWLLLWILIFLLFLVLLLCCWFIYLLLFPNELFIAAQEMDLFTVPSDKLRTPPVTFDDFLKALFRRYVHGSLVVVTPRLSHSMQPVCRCDGSSAVIRSSLEYTCLIICLIFFFFSFSRVLSLFLLVVSERASWQSSFGQSRRVEALRGLDQRVWSRWMRSGPERCATCLTWLRRWSVSQWLMLLHLAAASAASCRLFLLLSCLKSG